MPTRNYLPETWTDKRVELRPSPIHGDGLFATAPIHPGEVVQIWGGLVFNDEDVRRGRVDPSFSITWVEDDVWIAGPRPAGESLDYHINHSCDSNLWMLDNVTVIARHLIQAGEELTLDYAIWQDDNDYRLDPCRCGSALCRGRMTGNDWMKPELQERYAGHFVPAINQRIARGEHNAQIEQSR